MTGAASVRASRFECLVRWQPSLVGHMRTQVTLFVHLCGASSVLRFWGARCVAGDPRVRRAWSAPVFTRKDIERFVAGNLLFYRGVSRDLWRWARTGKHALAGCDNAPLRLRVLARNGTHAGTHTDKRHACGRATVLPVEYPQQIS